MHKKFLLMSLLLASILLGCAPQSLKETQEGGLQEKSEFLMIQAKNYKGLIDLYTSLLSKELIEFEEKNVIRFKLANVYFNAGDAEAALFQLELLPEGSVKTKKRYLLQAKAQYKESNYEAAQISLDKAFLLDDKYAEGYNFQGVLFTEQGMLYDARKSFSIARQHEFDDVSVRNNLAMLDIIEGDFDSALKILLPILHSGQADDMIKANMILIYAKLNKFKEFRSMLGKKLSDEEVFERFQLMHNIEIVKSIRTDVSVLKDVNPDKFFKNRDGVLIVPNNDASQFYDRIKENEVNSGATSTDSLEYMLNNNLLYPDVILDNETSDSSFDSELARRYKVKADINDIDSGQLLSEPEKTQILGITYEYASNVHRFFIVFSGKVLSYNNFDLLAGGQWVVDIQGTFKRPDKSIYKFDNEFVEQSTATVYSDFARVIFKMKSSISFAPVLMVKNNTLIVEWKTI
jgi:Flp pilus assembly protein TadD